MAAPVDDSYVTPVGEPLYAGIDLRPAWWQSQAVSTWKAIGSNTVNDVQPGYTLSPGAQRMIIDAWSGGALIYRSGRPYLAINGGGHGDYWGNEVPGFDLLADVPSWSLLAQPSAAADCIFNDLDGIYPDGRPSSQHTYDCLQYSASIDKLLMIGQGASWSGPAYTFGRVWSCDMTTGAWAQRANFPSGVIPAGSSAVHPTSGAGGTEEIWYIGTQGQELHAYHPLTDTWRGPYGYYYKNYQSVSAIDPVRDVMICIGGIDGMLEWDLLTSDDPIAPAITGTGPEEAYKPGFAFVPSLDRFIAWDGGQALYVLNHTVTPHTWTALTVGGATPSAPSADNQGVFGRFRYVPGLHGLLVVTNTFASTYFFKLPATL